VKSCWTWSPYHLAMRFTLEIEQEEDGRWIVEIPELSGILA
jgi:predicted RNase H-like HicB family nuclease